MKHGNTKVAVKLQSEPSNLDELLGKFKAIANIDRTLYQSKGGSVVFVHASRLTEFKKEITPHLG